MAKYVHKCEKCGKEFEDYCKTTKFCSRDCYDTYRKNNGKLKELVCPICNNLFKQAYPKQTFCSVECRTKSTENKVKCICEYCGKEFNRKKSEVDKNKRHYCSVECKRNAMWWSDEDTELLISSFGKMSYKEMEDIFAENKTVDEIKRRAVYIGLTSSKEWSCEETQILLNNYSTMPMADVLQMLPNRTQLSILGKAKSLGLKSYFYLNKIYSEDDNEYLRNNYLNNSNEELALKLNRNTNGIAQHLWVLGLHRPNDRSGYNDLAEYIRGRLIPWFKKVKIDNNFTCAITKKRSNIVVHHIHGFNLILSEAINNINFPIYDCIGDYTDDQLDGIFLVFCELQEMYGSYICITESVHKKFHSLYGYGNNTEEQWNEFINTYYNN